MKILDWWKMLDWVVVICQYIALSGAALLVLLIFVIVTGIYPPTCPKGMTCCPKQNYDYIVVDSVGRRYRPVRCAPESYECKECGDFAPALEANETAQEDEMPVTIIYSDRRREKKIFYFTNDCGYECSPGIKLELIK